MLNKKLKNNNTVDELWAPTQTSGSLFVAISSKFCEYY